MFTAYKPKSHGRRSPKFYRETETRRNQIILREWLSRWLSGFEELKQWYLFILVFLRNKKRSIHTQMKVQTTNNTSILVGHVLEYFTANILLGPLGVLPLVIQDLWILCVDSFLMMLIKVEKKKGSRQPLIPFEQFGFTSLLKATALRGCDSIARSKLIGGHSAGGLDGLK